MDAHSILTYTLVAAIAIASPGPATLVALHNSVAYGAKSTLWSSLGNISGLFCMSAAAMLGLGALIASSEWVFNAVKIVGAGYLFYLGAKQLFSKSQLLSASSADDGKLARPPRLKLFKSAFLTAATNPKATLFFLAIFTTIISASTPLEIQALYGLWMCSVNALWFVIVALFFSSSKVRLLFMRMGHWFERSMGVILILFAGRLVLSM